MIAGLPGTGIGGIFYLLLAIWMPIRQIWTESVKKTRPKGWKRITQHLFMTLCIIAGMTVTGLILGYIISNIVKNSVTSVSQKVVNVLHVTPFIISIATLIFVFILIHLTRVFLRFKGLGLRKYVNRLLLLTKIK